MKDMIEVSEEQLGKLKQIEMDALVEVDRICKKHGIRYSLAFGTLIGAARHQGFIPWDDDIDIIMPREDYVKFRAFAKEELNENYFLQTQETDPEYFHLFDKVRVNHTVFRENYLGRYDINHGVYIDIYICDNVPDQKLLKLLQIVRYQFFRIGLNSKYLDVTYRIGIKKIVARIIRALYVPFSMSFLYRHANRIAKEYRYQKCKNVIVYADPPTYRCSIRNDDFCDMPLLKFEGYEFPCLRHYDEVLRRQYGDYMKLPPEEDRYPHHHLLELKL